MNASSSSAAPQKNCEQLRAEYGERVKAQIRDLLEDSWSEERFERIAAGVWKRVELYCKELAKQEETIYLRRLVRVAAVFELGLDDPLLNKWKAEKHSHLGDLVYLRLTLEVDKERFCELWRRRLLEIKGFIGLKFPAIEDLDGIDEFLLDLRLKVWATLELREFNPELSEFSTYVHNQARFQALKRLRDHIPIAFSIGQRAGKDGDEDKGPDINDPNAQPWKPVLLEESKKKAYREFWPLLTSNAIRSRIKSLLTLPDTAGCGCDIDNNRTVSHRIFKRLICGEPR